MERKEGERVKGGVGGGEKGREGGSIASKELALHADYLGSNPYGSLSTSKQA